VLRRDRPDDAGRPGTAGLAAGLGPLRSGQWLQIGRRNMAAGIPRWLRLSPRAADGALAAVVAGLGGLGTLPAMQEHPQPAVIAIPVAMGLLLYPRRRLPGSVLAAVAALAGWLVVLRPASDAGFLPVLISSYSAVVYGTRRLALALAAAAVLALATAGIGAAATTAGWFHGVTPRLLLAAAGASLAGWIIRGQFAARSAQLALLSERAELTAERQRDQAQRVRLSERLRIARELHDIVAHHITVAVIQAQGAQRVAEHDPARARQAMAETERTARSALDEMRRLLSLLRSGDTDSSADNGTESRRVTPATASDHPGESDRAVLPGIADIGPLAERVRAAGVEVTLELTGSAARVPEDIALAAYRIVQEALTNVLKHAGNARARVSVDLTDDVVITVTDDGRGAAAHLDGARCAGTGLSGSSRGLTGMAERATAAGGSLTAGPRVGGGFEVRALIPLADL
jgi:signal transduction histidine kinase